MQYSSSDYYLWNLSDFLGKGATGAVYKGRHKKNGNPVAIKVFNSENASFWRELEILKNTPIHENIVRFITMETEHPGHRRVIVMELCTGGSLYSIIDNPENGFGLVEDELVSVIKDVVSGLNHLHQHQIIHRDIKPGNIMRCIAENGSHIYKLVDFGAARQLDPHDTFTSLYGTEEYLHPDMYERAVLRKNRGKAFTQNVDLWSIGATFYHVITGKLPFRPFLGRSDQQTMFCMTGQKKSGVISAYQEERNGKIIWETEFPHFISSFEHLRNSLRFVLAGILESNPDHCMSFRNFVNYIIAITSSKCVTIFCLYNSSFLRIYIRTGSQISDWYKQLTEEVATLTQMPANTQVYFFNNQRYIYLNGDEVPDTTMDMPFFLITSTKVIPPAYFAVPPDFHFAGEPIALDKDCHNTRNAQIYLHFYLKTCKNVISCSLLIETFASTLFSAVTNSLSRIHTVINTSKQVLSKLKIVESVTKYIFESLLLHSGQGAETYTGFSKCIQGIQLELSSQSSKILSSINEFELNFGSLENFSILPFSSLSPRLRYLVIVKQFNIHLESLREAQGCFHNDLKRNIVNDHQRDNHKFFIQQAYHGIRQSRALYEQVKSSHIQFHLSFIQWFQSNIERKIMLIHELSLTLTEMEEVSTALNDDIEIRLHEIFNKYLEFLKSNSSTLSLSEHSSVTHESTISSWKHFILQAGPSILSLERLATSLSDLHP